MHAYFAATEEADIGRCFFWSVVVQINISPIWKMNSSCFSNGLGVNGCASRCKNCSLFAFKKRTMSAEDMNLTAGFK